MSRWLLRCRCGEATALTSDPHMRGRSLGDCQYCGPLSTRPEPTDLTAELVAANAKIITAVGIALTHRVNVGKLGNACVCVACQMLAALDPPDVQRVNPYRVEEAPPAVTACDKKCCLCGHGWPPGEYVAWLRKNEEFNASLDWTGVLDDADEPSAARVDEPATPPAELWCMYCNAWHTPAGCEVIGSAGEGSSS